MFLSAIIAFKNDLLVGCHTADFGTSCNPAAYGDFLKASKAYGLSRFIADQNIHLVIYTN